MKQSPDSAENALYIQGLFEIKCALLSKSEFLLKTRRNNPGFKRQLITIRC